MTRDGGTIHLELTIAQAHAVRSSVWWAAVSLRAKYGDAKAFAQALTEVSEKITAALLARPTREAKP